jgi:hypothetical protein
VVRFVLQGKNIEMIYRYSLVLIGCQQREKINIIACRALLIQRHKMGGYSTAVSGQRLGKHVPVARQQIPNNTIVEL